MDRFASGCLIFCCLLVVSVGAVGWGGATAPAVTADADASNGLNETNETNGTTGTNVSNITDVDPTFENVTVPIEDAEPFEFGTTVVIQEETLMSMTLRADQSDIEGNVSVRESHSPAVDSLSENRTVHNAIDIMVPDNATTVPATLQLVVLAQPIETRESLEVLRHNDGEWESLETTILSNRTWSSDRGASVLLVEAETPGFSTFAVTEPESSSADSAEADETDENGEPLNESETDAATDSAFIPEPEADVYRITDRRPFEFGTFVHIHEETVREITFQAPNDEIEGFVAINDSNSSAVDELSEERPVVRALNITATPNASQTPATLHLSVRAIAVDDRDAVELMRYDEQAGSWEPLRTEVVSDRYWSSDHEASVFDVEAETPGFSMFAVTEQPDEPAVDDDDANDDSSEESEPDSADTESEGAENDGLVFGLGLLELVVVLIVLGGGAAAVVVVRRR